MAIAFNSRNLKRKQGEASGKVPSDANGPNLPNKRKSLHSAEHKETIEVIKAANHFHRHRNQHSH